MKKIESKTYFELKPGQKIKHPVFGTIKFIKLEHGHGIFEHPLAVEPVLLINPKSRYRLC